MVDCYHRGLGMSSKVSGEEFILNGLRQNAIRFIKESNISDNPITVVSNDSYDGNEGRDYTHVETLKGVSGFITLKKTKGEYTGYLEVDHAIIAKYKYERMNWVKLTA